MKRERQRGRLIQTWRGLGHIPGARELSVRNSVPVEAVSLDGWLKNAKWPVNPLRTLVYVSVSRPVTSCHRAVCIGDS